MSDLIGKVVHHGKFGYGVGWRNDKFHRVSVKFESGKEVGGFAPTELRIIEKDEFSDANVLERLKAVGLDSYIDMKAEEAAAQVKVDDIERNRNFFERVYQETRTMIRKPDINLDKVINRQIELLEESNLDGFSKQKISKRLSRIDSFERLSNYLSNSLMRYRKLDEEKSLIKLNIMLTELIKNMKELYNG